MNEVFCSGDLKEEFFYIKETKVWTREEVLNECSDELSTNETMINLFAYNLSRDVKIDLLNQIRDNVIEKLRSKL